MKKPVFTGSAVALITPYLADLSDVDFEAYGRLIEFQIENGTDALVVCATTGEAPTLSDEEHHACIDFAVKRAAGRIKVIAGTGSNDTRHAVDMSNYAVKAGADAVLMVVPYYNKPTQKGLYESYKYIAERVETDIIVYNIPTRTNICISADTYEGLAAIPNINGVKEASGDFNLLNDIFHRCGDELNVWAGNDELMVPLMSLGGKGVVSTAANIIPAVIRDITHRYLAGDHEGAARLQIEYFDVLRDLFIETNPIPVKTAAKLMGLPGGAMRLPLCDMTEPNFERLKATLKKHRLI